MKRAALAAIVLCSAAASANAHTVIPGIGGFRGGLLHPLLVPSHVLALVALGLLAACLPRRERLYVLAVFVLAAMLAFVPIAMAFSTDQAEMLILGLGAAIGLILAAALVPPLPVAVLLAAILAVLVMFDSVPPVPSVGETMLSLTGTALAASALCVASALLFGLVPARIAPIAVRILGSWIAASAIMVLALRLAA
jgi:urease accessory protein